MGAYGLVHDVAYEGTRGDSRPATIHSGRNNHVAATDSSGDIPFGRFVIFDSGSGTSDLAIKIRAAAGERNQGVLIHDMAHELPLGGVGPGSAGLAPGGMGSVLSQGCVWMVAENTVARDSKVYVRHTANGSPGASDGIGRVRSDADALAQVQTVTPAADGTANSTNFSLTVGFLDGSSRTFEYKSDSSQTAAEVVTGLKAVMVADLAFTARIVATGTTTLILTAQNASLDQSVAISSGDGTLTVVNTTPAAPHADLEPRARFLDGGTIGQMVRVELNLP